MSALVGVTQGRLVTPPPGIIQYFPQREWRDEMALVRALGMNFVEWLVERQHNDANPIWTDEGTRAIAARADEAGLVRHSTVNDYIIDHDLAGANDARERQLQLIERCRALGLRMIVVPLFEASDATPDNYQRYVPALREAARAAAAAGVELALETVLTAQPLRRLLDLVHEPNVSVCFDSGNRAALGHDIDADVANLGAMIHHVHIKDKNDRGENVLLGTGLVDFHRFFRSLADAGFAGSFTLETPRGRDPVATARYHLELIHFFGAEAGMGDRGPGSPRPRAARAQELV